MKTHRSFSMLIMALLFTVQEPGMAETRYVSLSGGHVSPFTNWADAATTIQAAIDVSEDGDTVRVTNGIYAAGGRTAPAGNLTNRIMVSGAIDVRSVNGPTNTVILGQGPLGESAIRCAYLEYGATLSGFTLSNGCTRTSDDWQDQSGGGAFGGQLSDCLIVGNAAQSSGGGVCDSSVDHCTISANSAENGGGTFNSRVTHCALNGNIATNGGGAYGGNLEDCLIRYNTATTGGGVYGSILFDCRILGNTAERGGGVSLVMAAICTIESNSARYGGGSSDSTISFCTIQDNVAASDGGGSCDDAVAVSIIRRNRASDYGGGLSGGWSLDCRIEKNHADWGGGLSETAASNCTVQGNQADQSGGGGYGGTLYSSLLLGNSAGDKGGGHDDSTLYNCTVVGNQATNQAGGCNGGRLYNCIVWSNRAASDANFSGGTYAYCCTTPNPGGLGNLTDDPRFVDATGKDYHLQSNSPCVNAGTNQDWMANATDLDGNPRIRGGCVDMGAYERMFSLMPDEWLKLYSLKLDGSDDFQDNDGDGMNNWREWRCETDPTNRLSLLKCIADNSLVTSTGIVVRWQSVAGKLYTVERSTNLMSPFKEIATDILAEAESTTHTDTTAVGSGPWFYRVGVK